MASFEIEKPKQWNSDNSSSSDDIEDDQEQDPTEWMAKLFPTREKTVRKGCRAIPIPDEIFKLLEYFQKTIREHLKPNPKAESLWISFKNGTVQQGYQMSIAVKNQIAEFLPGKQITPLDLRRSMPTIIQKFIKYERRTSSYVIACEFGFTLSIAPRTDDTLGFDRSGQLSRGVSDKTVRLTLLRIRCNLHHAIPQAWILKVTKCIL